MKCQFLYLKFRTYFIMNNVFLTSCLYRSQLSNLAAKSLYNKFDFTPIFNCLIFISNSSSDYPHIKFIFDWPNVNLWIENFRKQSSPIIMHKLQMTIELLIHYSLVTNNKFDKRTILVRHKDPTGRELRQSPPPSSTSLYTTGIGSRQRGAKVCADA